MSGSHPLPPKKEVALALLERSSVHVHLDPRATGVVVPPWFKKQAQLVLQVGLNMPVPIPDLRLDDAGMTCTLSFNRSPFYCVVPWPSVYAMVGEDGRGMVWPDDVPPEVAQQAREGARKAGPSKRGETVTRAGGSPERVEAIKGRKPRKRPRLVPDAEPARALSAVPPPEPKRPVIAPVAQKPAIEPSSRRPSDNNGASRQKRELPPYLRVVK